MLGQVTGTETVPYWHVGKRPFLCAGRRMCENCVPCQAVEAQDAIYLQAKVEEGDNKATSGSWTPVFRAMGSQREGFGYTWFNDTTLYEAVTFQADAAQYRMYTDECNVLQNSVYSISDALCVPSGATALGCQRGWNTLYGKTMNGRSDARKGSATFAWRRHPDCTADEGGDHLVDQPCGAWAGGRGPR